jgi:glycosyltransferase involved in cell wall biosynthesis
MKVLFYDWCLHNIGGGQKFDCKIAEHLSKKNEVDILTLFPVDRKKLEKAYSVDLSKVKRFRYLYKNSKANASFLHLISFKKVSRISEDYDLFLNADAHETVKPLAKYNIMYCHFFEPKWYKKSDNFQDLFKVLFVYMFKSFFGNYSKCYDAIYCNSLYTKKWLKRLWKVEADVIYPPVDIPKKIEGKKEDIIISSGRLTPDKNYEFVIECFKRVYDSYKEAKKYRCLICGVKYEQDYYEKLKKLAEGYPIEILTNLNDWELKKIYSKAKIFIQAKGLGIDEQKYPALLEHFGMAAAEAMSYGCVPIALNKAGYRETVDNGKSGFLFMEKEEAMNMIDRIIKNKRLFSKMSVNARSRAKRFSLERMQKETDNAIEKAIKSKKL